MGSAAVAQLNRLVVLQKRAIRILSGSQCLAHSSPLFANLKLLKLVDINKYLILLFLFKHKHFILPAVCMHLVRISDTVCSHNTCTYSYFSYSTCRTIRQELDIGHRGPVIWNTLPATITQLSYITAFKKSLLVHFFSKY